MLPLLLFELLWKVIWVVASAIPMLLGPGLDEYASESLFACLMGVVVVPLVIPWGYVVRHYVQTPGEPWRSRPNAPVRNGVTQNMSAAPQVRRSDKLMSGHEMDMFLSLGYCGHLSTVGADGWPYVCPLLYVWRDRKVWVHNTSATGHLRSNIDHDSRACFEVASAGTVFAYGRYDCDTGIEYQSVIALGRIAIAHDRGQKAQFFDALKAKYHPNDSTRPRGFYPRLDDVTVYALGVERVTGKKTALPAEQARWPAVDNTKSPHVTPPQ